MANSGKQRVTAPQAGSGALAAPLARLDLGRSRRRDRGLAQRLRHYQASVVERLASLTAQTVGAETCAVLTSADSHRSALTVVAVAGHDRALLGRRCSTDAGLARRVLSSGIATAAPSHAPLSQPPQALTPPAARASAAAPIPLTGMPAGLLSVSTTRAGEAFGDQELGLLSDLAELCGLALGHGDQDGDRLAATAEGQVRALETALGVWDGYTAEHTDAVVRLALRVGQRLGMGALDLVELDLAARLHDVGKIRVPSDILVKPAPLSSDERAVVECHPAWGAELVGRIPGLEAIAAIVGLHHEQPDGAGYPRGLSGDRIPLAALVLAACDAYRAMTEDRPYRSALIPTQALAELRAAPGQFGPAVVGPWSERWRAGPPARPQAPVERAPSSSSLSLREREVLTLLAGGASNPEAAAALDLSAETVRTHVKRAMAKLNARTRTHAVALAIAEGQISPFGPEASP